MSKPLVVIIENIIPLAASITMLGLFGIPMFKAFRQMPSKKDPDYIKWLVEQKVKNVK